MINNITKKIKGLFSIKSLFRRPKETYAFYPSRDWKIVFFLFVFINIINGSLLAGLFFSVKKERFTSYNPTENTALISFDKELFEQRLSEYEDKSEKLEELKANRPQYLDPSI